MELNLKLKKSFIKKKIRTRWNNDKIKNDTIKIKYQIETDKKLEELKTDDGKVNYIEKIGDHSPVVLTVSTAVIEKQRTVTYTNIFTNGGSFERNLTPGFN